LETHFALILKPAYVSPLQKKRLIHPSNELAGRYKNTYINGILGGKAEKSLTVGDFKRNIQTLKLPALHVSIF
jgi:hypothetical protein